MKHFSLLQEYDIAFYKAKHWNFGFHKHSFFELIYILNGSGLHRINNDAYRYQRNDLFCLIPEDEHIFEINEETEFCIISFNKLYFSKNQSVGDVKVDFSAMFESIEYIIRHSTHLTHHPFNSPDEKEEISKLIATISREFSAKLPMYDVIIKNCVFTILALIARKVKQELLYFKTGHQGDSQISDVIHYIQKHILETEKLSLNEIARYSCKSKSQLSAWFKHATGSTVKDYIINYKVEMIKSKLKSSDLSITQIAMELGFSDESHLNKFFKSRTGMTARDFKRGVLDS
jgi:AraC-like DNA-binding protein